MTHAVPAVPLTLGPPSLQRTRAAVTCGPQAGAKSIEVTLEDQTNINNFNSFNIKLHELEAQITGQKASVTAQQMRQRRSQDAALNAARRCLAFLQKTLEELEDAGNELMLADDEEVRYVVGECFVHVDKEAAEERLQAMSETVTKEVARLTAELEEVKGKMKALKAVLYGKFGKSINL